MFHSFRTLTEHKTMLFLGLLMIVSVAEAAVGRACVGDSACDAGECCVQMGHMKGKRDATGTCQQMGTRLVNKDCYMENRFHYNGMYTNRCPCARGYSCESTGVMDIPYGMMGTCRPTVKRETPCQKGSDCGPHECCMSRVRPLGKRQAGGVCRAMGTSGSGCLVRYGSGKSDDMDFMCPCDAGMACKGNGHFDIPLGPMGTCVQRD